MVHIDKNNRDYFWGARGVFVGAIIAVLYDIAEYGLTNVLWQPTNPGFILLMKSVAFVISIGIGLMFWRRFYPKNKNENNPAL